MTRLSVRTAAASALLVLLASPSSHAAGEARPAFRVVATALIACIRHQAAVAETLAESPLAYSDRVHIECGSEITALIATASEPRHRRRILGAVRGAVTDAVIAYDARMSFRAKVTGATGGR